MMLKHTALGCIIFFNALVIVAQTTKVTAAGKTLDSNVVQTIQAIQPGFSLYGDSASIAEAVVKYYTLSKYLATQAKKTGIDTTKQMRAQISFGKQVLEEKLLADAYSKQLLENIPVTDQEGLAYYKQHLQQFSNPGRKDFFFVQVYDSSAKTLAAVKKFVAEKKADAGRGDTKVENQDYSITFSSYYTNNKEVPYYKEIMTAKKDTWISPFAAIGTKGQLYYYVMDGIEETYTPYETVKEVCMQNVRNAKMNALTEQWNAEAKKMYPIQVTPGKEIFAPGK